MRWLNPWKCLFGKRDCYVLSICAYLYLCPWSRKEQLLFYTWVHNTGQFLNAPSTDSVMALVIVSKHWLVEKSNIIAFSLLALAMTIFSSSNMNQLREVSISLIRMMRISVRMRRRPLGCHDIHSRRKTSACHSRPVYRILIDVSIFFIKIYFFAKSLNYSISTA